MYRISTSRPIGQLRFRSITDAIGEARRWGFPLYLVRRVRPVRRLYVMGD